MEQNLLDFIKHELKINKKDFYRIPYWDRVRMSKLAVQPDDDLGHKPLLAKSIDKNHHLLREIAIANWTYIKYEQVMITTHKCNHNDHNGDYKTYRLLDEVWFYV
jgi:hypothetical protein